MTISRLWPVVLLGALTAIRSATAQTAGNLLARGVRAYQNLDYPAAAGLMRRLLDESPSPPERSVQAKALSYLAAAEFFQGQRDTALATFRQMLERDARNRPEPLVFPPEVQRLFEEARRLTQTVSAELPREAEIRPDGPPLVAHLFASSPQDIVVTVGPGEQARRTLYEGPIGDSLDVRWDGRDSLSAPISGGHYLLKVVAREPSGRIHRSLEVPLEVTRQAQDTLPIPPAPDRRQILPERAGGAPPLAGLGRALVLVAAVVALPVAVGAESDAGNGRLVVAGAVGLSGIIRLAARGSGRAIPGNIQANRALRDAWRHRADSVATENARRRSAVRLVARVGEPIIRNSEQP